MKVKIKCTNNCSSIEGRYSFKKGEMYTYHFVKESEGYHMELECDGRIIWNPFDMWYINPRHFKGIDEFENQLLKVI